jgi:hypothetical protein
MDGPVRWRQPGWIHFGKRPFRLVNTTEQKKTASLEVPGVRSIDGVPVRGERRSRIVERLRRPAQVARGERDLGFRNAAPGARDHLFGSECARGTPYQHACPRKVPELRHSDAAKRKGRRVVAERDPLQRGQRITCR